MHRKWLLSSLLLALTCWSAPAYAQSGGGGLTANLNLFLGAKVLDEAEWAPVDNHAEVGVVGDIGTINGPISIELRLLKSASDAVILPVSLLVAELETQETNLGVRMTFKREDVTPRLYLSGGVSRIDADTTFTGISTATVSDSGLGYWLAGGIYWVLGDYVNMGMDLMISSAQADFGTGTDFNIGGVHFNFMLGLHL